MSKLIKRQYAPTSPFVRAALDFLHPSAFQNFGTLQEKTKHLKEGSRVPFKKEWLQDALTLFEAGLVETAYLHENNLRSVGGGRGDTFHIQFVHLSATGLAPYLAIELKSKSDYLMKVAFYKEARSIGTGIRHPKAKGGVKGL